ncbi:hypothetical protein [Halomontanus rarus]|uniref:hypothetical protein n=1 Tax=Halomontanus rarus TaxID=3034020 RepID=UPI0023E8925C|nr:hypothetical protein [Halovivax sp. TS33]
MTIEFQSTDSTPGIVVVDHIEGRRFPLTTRQPVVLQAASERLREPVDGAVSCRIEELTLPYVVPIFVRDASGTPIVECHDFDEQELPDGEYELEITAPIKLFCRVSGPVTISSTSTEMRITFEATTSITLAARSYHERPAATVTTTGAVEDLMTAISTFGSALKTTSPERSFPSLRGHPPAIEIGDTLSVPDAVSPPETGLQIQVPRDRTAVYAVATLAHYLGARVVPGEEARLLADGEVVRSLDGPNGLRGAVTETLQHVFLLDCIVRTEGRYQLNLHQRHQLAERVDLPLRELYDLPIAERITRYLDVPVDIVSDLVPTWYLSTHLSPKLTSVESLPYAANALSIICVEQRTAIDSQPELESEFESEPELEPESEPEREPERESEPEAFTRATRSPSNGSDASSESTYVRVSDTDTLERAWVGDGRAINANDLYLTGVQNRFASESTGDPITIGVVCNDERMVAEVDSNLYGDREELPFDVAIHANLTRGELRELLESDLDFLHYIGHVEREGFVCRDGTLDASDVDTVGVDTFLLNGCQSYDQGRAVIDAGGVGGIVTHGDVDNTSATAVGRLVAGLLNAGYSLRSALSVAGRRHLVTGQYSVIGDGGVQVAQSESGTPNLLEISRAPENDGYEVLITTYPTLGTAMGSCYTPYASSVDRYFLAGGELPLLVLSLPEVVDLLALERVPTIIDDEFWWSTDVSLGDLP